MSTPNSINIRETTETIKIYEKKMDKLKKTYKIVDDEKGK
jgi:hypothetical protein